MKRLTFIISCVTSKIKKYFSNGEKSDISHDCEMFLNREVNASSEEEIKCAKEYMDSYNLTTRWQTL